MDGLPDAVNQIGVWHLDAVYILALGVHLITAADPSKCYTFCFAKTLCCAAELWTLGEPSDIFRL